MSPAGTTSQVWPEKMRRMPLMPPSRVSAPSFGVRTTKRATTMPSRMIPIPKPMNIASGPRNPNHREDEDDGEVESGEDADGR